MKMEQRVTSVLVAPEGASIFDERGFTVSIEDDGGGEFVKVIKNCGEGSTVLDPEDWPELCKAISRMVEGCRSE